VSPSKRFDPREGFQAPPRPMQWASNIFVFCFKKHAAYNLPKFQNWGWLFHATRTQPPREARWAIWGGAASQRRYILRWCVSHRQEMKRALSALLQLLRRCYEVSNFQLADQLDPKARARVCCIYGGSNSFSCCRLVARCARPDGGFAVWSGVQGEERESQRT
jgi:hypothetical protein